MNKITFRKRLFALAVCVFAWVGVNAASVSTDDNGYTVVTTNNAGEISSLTDQQKATIKAATKLKLVGYYNSNDMQAFSNSDLNGPVTHLDFTNAHFAVSNGSSSQTVKPWKSNLTHFYMSKYETVNIDRDNMFENFNAGLPPLQEVKIDGQNINVPANCFQGLLTLKKVEFGNINRIGNNAFQGCKGLETLDLGSVKVIGETAFGACSKLTEVTIPGTVTSIETKAFTDCDAIEKITFDELKDDQGNSLVNMTIATEVFTQADKIWNVYVNTLGTITCANKAFDMSTTYAHGDPAKKTAVLHYPKEKAADYCNLNHVLDFATASNPAAFHDWLLEHFNRANVITTNGWHEFVESGTSEDEIPVPPTAEGKILKTFSFYSDVRDANNNHVTVAKIVPEGVKAYIINKVEKKNGNWQLTLKSIHAVPENTGVLLYGVPNSESETGVASLSMTTVPYDDLPITRENWNRFYKPVLDSQGKIVKENGKTKYTTDLDEEARNLLMPTSVDENGNETTATNKIYLTPYEPYGGTGPVQFRNFVLGTISQTSLASSYSGSNYYSYFRVRPGNISPGKSYLHLSAQEYTDADGGEAIVLPDPYYKRETKADGNVVEVGPKWTNRTWTDDPIYDWGPLPSSGGSGAKFLGEPIFEEVNEGVATIIIPVESVSHSGTTYTLQGTPISNPSKPGIYIQNGKKIIIK